jgi:hypothetical protein
VNSPRGSTNTTGRWHSSGRGGFNLQRIPATPATKTWEEEAMTDMVRLNRLIPAIAAIECLQAYEDEELLSNDPPKKCGEP